MRSSKRYNVGLALLLMVGACSETSAPLTLPAHDVIAPDGFHDTGHDTDPDAAQTPDSAGDPDPDVLATPDLPGQVLPDHPQRSGDPATGFQVLATRGYVGCGVPRSLVDIGGSALGFTGPPLPGREGDLPYYLTAFESKSGVELVSPNCLLCHADVLNGELVLGLGSISTDFGGMASTVSGYESYLAAVKGLITDTEYAELEKFIARMGAVAPYVQPLTAGVNPADNLAAALFAHRDPQTLAWHDEPILEPPPTHVVPVDVPPWWRMAKKHTMLYSGAGRGDHARIMMTASTLCVDDVDHAAEIDAWFPDVRAYIASLQAPAWPWAVDADLAERGQTVFEATCAPCHGTYGADESYPNLLIPLDVVGTDPALATGAAQFATRFVDWFNASFYGQMAHLDPGLGYVAPPLDGVWATAPFLHNGSVPTLAALLDSTQRPTYWRRLYGPAPYDRDAVGWSHAALEAGHTPDLSPQARRQIYDTTQLGYSNAGHPFGDGLSAEDRAAVIEYLKTL